MRKRKSREQIKPTMTNEQLQEFISAGINQSSIDARVNQVAIGLASDFKSKVDQRRGHDKGHEPVGDAGLGRATLGHEFERLVKEREAALDQLFKDAKAGH